MPYPANKVVGQPCIPKNPLYLMEEKDIDATIEMFVRAIVLNTNEKANCKNTHCPIVIWEDNYSLDNDYPPNVKGKNENNRHPH